MQTEVKEAGPFERLVTVRLDEDELERAKDRAARKLSRELKIKGFRPGKAPRRVVEATVGADELRQEAIEYALPEALGSALTEAALVPAVRPRVAELRDTEEGLEVDVKVTLWPRLEEPPSYTGRKVTLARPEVTEEEVSAHVDRLREQFAELEPASRPAEEGQYVSIDLSATHHGAPVEEASAKDLLYEVGSRSFIAGLDEQLVGRGAGEIAQFNATLPSGFGGSAGKEVTFRVLVKDVRRKKLPELTDEWVAEVSEFESIDELREQLGQSLEELKWSAIRLEFRGRLLDELILELGLVIPEALLGAEMERLLTRFLAHLETQGIDLTSYLEASHQDQRGFLDELGRRAERNLKTEILLEAVARSEGLTVSEEELDEAMAALAEIREQEGAAEGEPRGTQEEQRELVASDILRRKALEMLIEAAVAVDGQGRPIELQSEAPAADSEGSNEEPDRSEEERA